MDEWTLEQNEQAMIYGVCRVCGEPRHSEMLSTYTDDGTLEVTRNLVCGCIAQDAAAVREP